MDITGIWRGTPPVHTVHHRIRVTLLRRFQLYGRRKAVPAVVTLSWFDIFIIYAQRTPHKSPHKGSVLPLCSAPFVAFNCASDVR